MSPEARLRPRPLSPHLAIYRRTMTMMISIAHRLTGAAPYFGTLLLTLWLIAAVERQLSYQLFESWICSAAGEYDSASVFRGRLSSSSDSRPVADFACVDIGRGI